jgi:geranylgeranyl transferase type-2 subunit beta
LKLLRRLDTMDPRCELVRQHLTACQNDDGGFGLFPGTESHAGQTFCCLASLAMLDGLKHVERAPLLAWLQQRQRSDGGFNGRPEKVQFLEWIIGLLS